jgi:peptidyl-prolyl cis-trans isomerase B (cyclophilin B)
MPTNQQKRTAARRRLEQQLSQREQQQQAAARRRRRVSASIGGTVLLVAAIVIVIAVSSGGGGGKKAPTPTATPSASGAFAAKRTSGPCAYTTSDPGTNPALKNVGLPPDPTPTPAKTLNVNFSTNRGLIQVTLEGQNAPCNVQSLAYLIQKKFYDNTPCPRVVNSGIYVVQCGSGGATTSGGPTYTVPDENTAKASYTAGTIAMANTGQPHTANSQFFFITKDSSSGLGKTYTVVGHVTKGLDILQAVAAGGNDASAGTAGGGAPKLSLTFKTVQIVSVAGGGSTPGSGPAPTLVPAA